MTRIYTYRYLSLSICISILGVFPGGSVVKNLPATTGDTETDRQIDR